MQHFLANVGTLLGHFSTSSKRYWISVRWSTESYSLISAGGSKQPAAAASVSCVSRHCRGGAPAALHCALLRTDKRRARDKLGGRTVEAGCLLSCVPFPSGAKRVSVLKLRGRLGLAREFVAVWNCTLGFVDFFGRCRRELTAPAFLLPKTSAFGCRILLRRGEESPGQLLDRAMRPPAAQSIVLSRLLTGCFRPQRMRQRN